MADNSKTFKLPRPIIAKIAQGNNQAIKALENMETVALDTPDQIVVLTQLVEIANSNAMQAAMIANQLLAQQSPYLPAVAYSPDVDSYLPVVGHYEFTTINNITNTSTP